MAPRSGDDGPRPSLAPTLAAFVVVLGVDQATKAWALSALDTCASATRPRAVDLCLAFNQGMAFSMGTGSGPVIAVVALVIVGVLGASARKVPQLAPRILMGVVAGGALGNIADRAFRAPTAAVEPGFLRGAVVDFLYTSFWPTFNVADSCVVVGGIGLAILLWRMPENAAPDAPDAPEHAEQTSR